MATINNGLVGQEMRLQMECKKALEIKGSFYVGTGGKDITYKDIPETTGFDPGTTNNGVLIRDTSETATNTTGWKVAKITADNLEGGRVVQATNADQATKADTVSYDGNYKSFIDAFVSACLLKIYPIDSIYMSVKDVDPSTFLGGTWERWGQGRVPVGVDTSDADFATVEKTGGVKSDTYAHSHCTIFGNDDEAYYYLRSKYIYTPTSGNLTTVASFEPNNGSGGLENWNNVRTGRTPASAAGDSNVITLQPYITCYMWKRTA